MKSFLGMVAITCVVMPSFTSAGILNGSTWAPSEACGAKPQAPAIDDSSIDAYNKSVGAINEWQKKARTYYECLIKEANADNKIIADTANREQETYRQTVESIGSKADAAKKKLDNQ
ncbi:MAG: hypothetical protein ACU836_06770 [Gammaproteobacteria bacterium]